MSRFMPPPGACFYRLNSVALAALVLDRNCCTYVVNDFNVVLDYAICILRSPCAVSVFHQKCYIVLLLVTRRHRNCDLRTTQIANITVH